MAGDFWQRPSHSCRGWQRQRSFVSGTAKANPEINYIGIDIQKSVLSYALDKVLATDVPNIKLLWVDGSDLTDYFEEGEIDHLYLNSRILGPRNVMKSAVLTYQSFLATYQQILPENGEIHFKTDNRGLLSIA